MIIYKAAATIAVSLLVIYISEKKPRLGGLILGLPIGTGIVMVFYAIEQGISFVLTSIPYGILGLTCALFFCFGFYVGGKIAPQKPLINTLLAFSSGCLLFLLAGYTLNLFHFNVYGSILLLLLTISLSIKVYSRVPKFSSKSSGNASLSSQIFRILFVTALVLSITGGAGIFGTKWSGIMASFPTGLSSASIVLCYLYGNEKYPIVLKYFSFSITTLLVFYLSLLYALPLLGTALGFVAAYTASAVYLLILNRLIKKT